jgi:hypothetical protein
MKKILQQKNQNLMIGNGNKENNIKLSSNDLLVGESKNKILISMSLSASEDMKTLVNPNGAAAMLHSFGSRAHLSACVLGASDASMPLALGAAGAVPRCSTPGR